MCEGCRGAVGPDLPVQSLREAGQRPTSPSELVLYICLYLMYSVCVYRVHVCVYPICGLPVYTHVSARPGVILVLVVLYGMDTVMAVPEESEREMREPPNNHSALPMPATGRETQACPPHGCDPTAGVRDGMSDLESGEDLPPTASQGGMATCAARRQPAEDRQGTHAQLGGMAPARREGEEGTWHRWDRQRTRYTRASPAAHPEPSKAERFR